ncbi:uncharacterized protein LOC144486894 [Mustelus asterias]
MRTLLLILGLLIADSALTDPCVDHTALSDTWRSTDCRETECSNNSMCDGDLLVGWYRFKSSGGWKIPETLVAEEHCSTHRSGWLQGSHPTLEQGEVNRRVCFNWDGNLCSWEREIKIKNCSSYIVYELKPTPGCDAAYCTDPNSALTDPCVDHTVLNQPWRSSDCTGTECVGRLQCDEDLVYGWYRFNSSGGWKIPETPVAPRHCSTYHPGWLQGSHPTLEQGEVNRTVCLTNQSSQCKLEREIKIKNCSSYFVYELKPTPGCDAAYCTDPNSALTEPCVDHTVLNQPWRSSDCTGTECVGRLQCDEDLVYGWYRFNSSGGWKIPETPVAPRHCSTYHPGWLQGSHPTLEQGEVNRTVCLTNQSSQCKLEREIKIKNCSSYFVYELKPTPGCDAAYCTDPGTAPTLGADDKSQPESTDSGSPIPTESPNSGTPTPPTHGDQSTGESSQQSSSVPAGSPTSDPGTAPNLGADDKSQPESTDSGSRIPTESPNSGTPTPPTHGDQSTGESSQQSSSVPAGSPTSDPGTAPNLGADDKSQPESTDSGSRIPTESPNSGTPTPPTHGDQSTGESSQQSSSVPAGSPTSDPGTAPNLGADDKSQPGSRDSGSRIPTESPTSGTPTPPTHGDQSTGESSQQSSSVPGGSPTSDPGTAPTLGADDKSQPESTDSGSPIPTESPTSGINLPLVYPDSTFPRYPAGIPDWRERE